MVGHALKNLICCRFKLIPKSVYTKSIDRMVIELFVTKLYLFSYFITT